MDGDQIRIDFKYFYTEFGNFYNQKDMTENFSQKQVKKEIDCTDQSKNESKAPLLAQQNGKKEKIEVNLTKNTSMRVPRVTNERILCLVILLLAIPGCLIYINSDFIPTATYTSEQFNFQVYCPIYYDMNYRLKTQRDHTFAGYVMQHLYPLADKLSIYTKLYGQQQKRIYVVKVLDGQNQTNSTQYGMRYCGLARPRTGTCENDAKLICTNPGPTFETTKDQQIIVIWINGIYKLDKKHQSYVSKNLSSCYEIYANESDRPRFCTLISKLPEFRHLAYEDPTTVPPADQYQNYTINNMTTPISPYVHGMIGRPTFNGGPLSWFTSRGQVGLGYSTAEKENIDLMMSVIKRNRNMNEVLLKRYQINEYNYKIDIYQNRQQPANLMYYDSAISVMKKNLMSGLSGLYFIRDQQIEKVLPPQKYEHQILIHPSVAEGHQFVKSSNITKQQAKPIARASSQDYMIFRDKVYRFRIVNADFTKIYHKLKFIGANPSGEETIIDFYIVGTDSSLANKPIGPVAKIDAMAPAQRFDILIKFDKTLGQIVNLVHGQKGQLVTRIYLSQQSLAEGGIPSQLPSVPYTNYSIYESRVARRRMRPFSRTSDDHIATNGHLTIFEGESEDPVLGSVQDWYFINNIDVPHSIHLDLAEFQLMDQFTLNQVPNTHACTFYNVDFFMKYATTCTQNLTIGNRTYQPEEFANFVGQTLEDYQAVCTYMENLDKTQYAYCFDEFRNEHEKEGPRFLSGIDVQSSCNQQDKSAACTLRYTSQDDKSVIFKYKGEQIPIPEYRKGYKDIVIIPKTTYTRIRVRWARKDFPEDVTKQNQRQSELFYYASEEQLSQYPGFTYRSTQVRGEQSHMIRPIMMQPHPEGNSKTWKQIYAKLNTRQFENRRNRIYTAWHDDQDLL